jgi:addiction module HigA family antidote
MNNPTWREYREQNPYPLRSPERCPTHPGEILKMSIDEMGITQEYLAEAIGRTRVHMNRVLNGRSDVKIELALKLSKALGTTAEFWLNLQREVDLWRARRRIQSELDRMSLLGPIEQRLDEPMFHDMPPPGVEPDAHSRE